MATNAAGTTVIVVSRPSSVEIARHSMGDDAVLKHSPAAALALAAPPPPTSKTPSQVVVNQTTCNGAQYTYQQLAGYGFVASDARDKFGDTIGGHGSAIAIEHGSWSKTGNGSYTGVLWTLPDRGWNTQGTLNYQNRVHKWRIELTLMPDATVEKPSGPNFEFTYLDTVRFVDPSGQPTTGLDAKPEGPYLAFNGIDFQLPSTTYQGDGFGNPGSGGSRVVVDSEGLVIDQTGHFWVSDEYGPFIYQFDPSGKMVTAIKPPDAYIPYRNDSISYSADSLPIYEPNLSVTPSDPDSGRSNNQGFEGLTISDNGKSLWALMQSALIQDGAAHKSDRRNSRLLQIDLTQSPPAAVAEYVVQLPLYRDDSKVAAQSEIHHVKGTQFLVLARDSGAGAGQSSTESVYRHADVFDIAGATNTFSSANDGEGDNIASKKGKLHSDIVPATYCSWLDYNVNSQLNRFGVHNGGAQDAGLLNEKWESIALVPVDCEDDGEYFLISLSDNDFITQNGYLEGGAFKYKDASGHSLPNQALVFQVQIPKK
ncbi:hypothetical protein ANO11243_011200 [Dothideomycetidae sp. 11243]|nr:hypothetical protein ANO11243_011200 [fungal sp. No.11243]